MTAGGPGQVSVVAADPGGAPGEGRPPAPAAPAPADRFDVVVVGAGPAGLTAAYELTRQGRRPLVIEQQGHVGGLAWTAEYRGFHFDLGGHRFFTKVPEVEKLWQEVLGTDLLVRPRLSRIYYRRRFFHYPLRPGNALRGLGVAESLRVVGSYLWWQVFPHRPVDTFEQWVTNRFGRRLFEIFFRAYTEKVWGISCSELRADWAAQRIRDLSLRAALVGMVRKPGRRIRTLIEEFHYPRLGPGMMWDAVRDEVVRRGGEVWLDSPVVQLRHRDGRLTAAVVRRPGGERVVEAAAFISSMPLRDLIGRLDPPPPDAVGRAAARLTYRDFLTVCLILRRAQVFPDNWIYVHDPGVRTGRIQNFKNWSPAMVPDGAFTGLGLEYFCAEGDELWCRSDAELVALGARELEQVGLARADEVVDGCVVRVPRAYPVYDARYAGVLDAVRDYLEGFDNFQTIGRNGLHRYNNQDHAMLTGLIAARNVARGGREDVWRVNAEEAYHEAVAEPAPAAPADLARAVEGALGRVFLKVDRVALGTAGGAVAGTLLLLVTLVASLTTAGGPGLPLGLLAQFFPGYTVSPGGALVGFAYGFAGGFLGGWWYAWLRNLTVFLYLTLVRRRLERRWLRRILDYV